MKFRTEYLPARSALTLDPGRPAVMAGSCFAQNIAEKMRQCQWPVFSGIGTLYNPLSIARVLELMVFDTDFSATIGDSLFEAEDYVHSWLFDSHFSRQTAQLCIEKAEETRRELLGSLERAQALIVTFGTAWCYFLGDRRDYVVANCHKMPQTMFERRRITADEISAVWTDLCRRLRQRYPGLQFIFTVSPVRHLKDGFEGNARSKATLLLAAEKITGNAEGAIYFPAYEIVNDDLRDYRFYADDLTHPSEAAVEYLWEMFQATFVDAKGVRTLREGNRAWKRQNHRNIKN